MKSEKQEIPIRSPSSHNSIFLAPIYNTLLAVIFHFSLFLPTFLIHFFAPFSDDVGEWKDGNQMEIHFN